MHFEKFLNRLNVPLPFNESITDIGPDHDPTNRAKAFDLAFHTDKIYLGLFYKVKRPTFNDHVKAIAEKAGRTQLDIEKLFYKFV